MAVRRCDELLYGGPQREDILRSDLGRPKKHSTWSGGVSRAGTGSRSLHAERRARPVSDTKYAVRLSELDVAELLLLSGQVAGYQEAGSESRSALGSVSQSLSRAGQRRYRCIRSPYSLRSADPTRFQ